jgi:predicted permease
LWQRLFDGRRSIVGETIRLNGVAFSVVGIAPRSFAGGQRGIVSGIWIPVAAASLVESNIDVDQRGDRSYFVMGRLAPGISLPQAQAVMNTVAGNLTAAHPEAWRDVSGKGRRISLASEFSSRVPPMVRGPVIGFMALLMGTVGLVLLVCCANVASLMLARASRRSREMGVRLALGATRGRVARHLLTESAILAVVGATLGVVLSLFATRAIMAFQPPLPLPVALDLELDGRVLAFTVLVALATGVIFGIAPAWQASRARVTGMLKGEGGASLSGRRVTLQQVLVVSQVAVSLLLLVAALFFVRSLRSAGRIDAGFATDHLLIVDAQPRPDLREGSTWLPLVCRSRSESPPCRAW